MLVLEAMCRRWATAGDGRGECTNGEVDDAEVNELLSREDGRFKLEKLSLSCRRGGGEGGGEWDSTIGL